MVFGKKDPVEKWRSRNKVAAAFADHTGWEVDLASGAVHTRIDGVVVTALLSQTGNSQIGVIIEAGAQAERTLANSFGDDGGTAIEFDGWRGTAGPGSGLLEGGGRGGPDLFAQIITAANHLVAHTQAP